MQQTILEVSDSKNTLESTITASKQRKKRQLCRNIVCFFMTSEEIYLRNDRVFILHYLRGLRKAALALCVLRCSKHLKEADNTTVVENEFMQCR